MNDPSSPLGWHVWRRGSLLGIQWLAVFVVATLLLYLLLGVIGWSGIAQAMCAMFAGPVFGIAVIVAWWIARRPTVAPEVHSVATGEGDQGDE